MPAVGTLGEAMQAAGVTRPKSAETRLHNMALAALNQPNPLTALIHALNNDPEATLILFSIDEISARAQLKLNELARENKMQPEMGQKTVTDGHEPTTKPRLHATSSAATKTSGRQSSGAGAGHTAGTDGHVVSTSAHPGHAKQRDPAALRAVAATVATSVLDTFAILDRNGERMPVGDIYVSSYDRLIHMTGKRSWRASREHALLNLLKAEVARKAAYLPAETKTRDIFDAADIERMLTTATSLATPKLSEADAA